MDQEDAAANPQPAHPSRSNGPRQGRSVRDRGDRGGQAAARTAPGGKRHQARILALQILFETDVTNHPVDEVIARVFAEDEAPPSLQAHVNRLVRGVHAARETIDPYIGEAAPAFPVTQLPAVDRNVLRLAIFELLNEPNVPLKAAINEAVELGKRFGGDNSGRFVNGVLGTIADRIGPDRGGIGGEASQAPPG